MIVDLAKNSFKFSFFTRKKKKRITLKNIDKIHKMTSLSTTTIPIIDWRFEDDCVEEMYKAYSTCGFAVFTPCL